MQFVRIKQGSLVELDKELLVWPCEYLEQYDKKELEKHNRTKKDFYLEYLRILYEVVPPIVKRRRMKINGNLLLPNGEFISKTISCWFSDLIFPEKA